MTVPKKKEVEAQGYTLLIATIAVAPQWQFPTTDIPSEIQL